MNLLPGDKIRMTARNIDISGVVKTAVNYGTNENPDWYIEFSNEDGGGYLKQVYDACTYGEITVTKLEE